MDSLTEIDARYPGFTEFYSRLLGYYFACCPREHPEVAERLLRALKGLGEEAEPALQEFAAAGIFSGKPFSTKDQVELFWKSPLMALFEAAIGYNPPLDTDLSSVIPAPVEGILDLIQRRVSVARATQNGEMARGELPYWRACLANCAPELYLLPFLSDRERFTGVDIGCGWGRGTLTLPNLNRFRVTAVDVSEEQLAVLSRLALNMGWDGLETQTELSQPPDSADFGVSMAFLDLLEREQILQILRDLLRVLRIHSPMHIEAPTRSKEGITVVTQFSVEQLVDMFHSVEANGKIFQLLEYDPRIPDLFTFAVLAKDALPDEPRTGRKAHRYRTEAKRLVTGEAKSPRRRRK